MKYKIIHNGYVLCIGEGKNGTPISDAEYDQILQAIAQKPAHTNTVDYRLRCDLTWEAYEIEPPEADPEIDDAEALEILLGGAV